MRVIFFCSALPRSIRVFVVCKRKVNFSLNCTQISWYESQLLFICNRKHSPLSNVSRILSSNRKYHCLISVGWSSGKGTFWRPFLSSGDRVTTKIRELFLMHRNVGSFVWDNCLALGIIIFTSQQYIRVFLLRHSLIVLKVLWKIIIHIRCT